jgi:hypothetical protein
MIMISGRTSEWHSLSVQQRDTVRLLVARVIEEPVSPCTSQAYYRLQVAKKPAVEGPDCGFPERQLGVRALTALLENCFRRLIDATLAWTRGSCGMTMRCRT